MQMDQRDNVFGQKLGVIPKFSFNDNVANVFEDMLERSVPFYNEIHKIILDLARYSLKEGSRVYDLGCSTGTTLMLIDEFFKQNKINGQLIGVDNSSPMVKKAEKKLSTNNVSNFELNCQDLETFSMNNADMVIMNYTLQFVERSERINLLRKIKEALNPGQFFVLSEKINCGERDYRELVTELYYDFKRRNGYSELEISQKREALENVLVPLSPEENIELLNEAGFTKVEMIFRWYNFACFLGTK